jgi:hypothetical protein
VALRFNFDFDFVGFSPPGGVSGKRWSQEVEVRGGGKDYTRRQSRLVVY